MFLGRGYDEISIGDRFERVMTLTETHIVLGAGLFNDFNPVHVNQQFAAQTIYQGRIAHGYLTSNFMAAHLGMIVEGTGIAYLEHNIRFTAPVRAGDTLSSVWVVSAKDDKAKYDGGIASFTGICTNQRDEKVAEAEAKMLMRKQLPAGG